MSCSVTVFDNVHCVECPHATHLALLLKILQLTRKCNGIEVHLPSLRLCSLCCSRFGGGQWNLKHPQIPGQPGTTLGFSLN